MSVRCWYARGLVGAVAAAAYVGTGHVAAVDDAAFSGVYGLHYNATLELGGGAAGGLIMTGELAFDGSRATLNVFDCLATDGRTQKATPEIVALCDAMQGVYQVQLDTNGALRAISFGDEFNPGARLQMSFLFAAAQFSVPTDSDADAWSATEYDTVGEYRAEYTRAGATVTRSKREYLRQAETDGLIDTNASSIAVEGDTRFELNDAGTVIVLEFEERLRRVDGDDEIPDGTAATRIELTRIPGRQPQIARIDTPNQVWREPWSQLTDLERQKLTDVKRMGTLDFEGLMDVLRERPPRSVATVRDRQLRERWDRHYLALIGQLRNRAEVRKEARKLCASTLSQFDCLLIIKGLGRVGSRTAQETLHALFADLDPGRPGRNRIPANRASLRREVVRALGTQNAGQLTLTTQGLLISLLDDPLLGSQAAYGLGAAAYRQREDTGELLAPLLSRLFAGRGSEVVLLRALANAGDPGLIDEARLWIQAPNEAISAAAVGVVRRMPDNAEVDEFIAYSLLDERDAVVHAALIVVAERDTQHPVVLERIEALAAAGRHARLAKRILEKR